MSNFENTLQSASLAILKRELTDNERIEFLELAGAIGMSSVEDYLYMLMIFKRNEDRVNGTLNSFRSEIKERFDEISDLEMRIDTTLENSIENMLNKRAEKIGHTMGRDIVESAKEVLKTNGRFHFLRGQVMSICIVALMASMTYALGMMDTFGLSEGNNSFFNHFLQFPGGGVAILCGFIYTLTWYLDHEWQISSRLTYKIKFTLQALILLALLFRVFTQVAKGGSSASRLSRFVKEFFRVTLMSVGLDFSKSKGQIGKC